MLSLDADERIPPDLREEIGDVLQENPPIDGYWIARKNYFLGRWIRYCGWYPDRNLRLFRKGRGRFTERAVHERIEVLGKTATLNQPLIHETYRSLSEFFVRSDRYSSLAAGEMKRQGRKCGWWDFLFRPPVTFLQMYLLRAGFMEGYWGFLLSVLYSYYTFAKYAKLKELGQLEKP